MRGSGPGHFDGGGGWESRLPCLSRSRSLGVGWAKQWTGERPLERRQFGFLTLLQPRHCRVQTELRVHQNKLIKLPTARSSKVQRNDGE